MQPEPVFVDILRSPGIDFQPGGPVRQPYLSYWLVATRLHRMAESIPRNRLLGSINFYKYGLWRAGKITLFVMYRPACQKSSPRNRFMGLLNVYKFGLCSLSPSAICKKNQQFVQYKTNYYHIV